MRGGRHGAHATHRKGRRNAGRGSLHRQSSLDRERSKAPPPRHSSLTTDHLLRLQFPQQRRPGLWRDLEPRRQRLRRQRRHLQQCAAPADDRPPLPLPRPRLQPIELAQSGAGTFGDEVQEGERLGDRPAPAGEVGGGIGVGWAAHRGRRTPRPAGGQDVKEQRAGRTAAARHRDGGEQRDLRRWMRGDAAFHPGLGRLRGGDQWRQVRLALLPGRTRFRFGDRVGGACSVHQAVNAPGS